MGGEMLPARRLQRDPPATTSTDTKKHTASSDIADHMSRCSSFKSSRLPYKGCSLPTSRWEGREGKGWVGLGCEGQL